MEPHCLKFTITVKAENNNNGSSVPSELNSMEKEQNDINSSTVITTPENGNQNPIDVSSEGELDQSSEQEDQSSEDAQNQLVLYDPSAVNGGEIIPVPGPVEYQTPPIPRSSSQNQNSRVLPSVGAFTVQCATCFKWRLIPTKEKYEEIREHILEQPFYCDTARDWRPEISCDDPPDLTQDGSRLWAIDKPNIAQPPPGWQRLLRIRGEGGTKFADVYYEAPSGKKLRSIVEVEKYLQKHPEYMEQGVRVTQFSFQIPRPLQENYVRKRPARSASLHDGSGSGFPESLEPSEANPISWVSPDEATNLHLGGPGLSNPYANSPLAEPGNEPKRRRMPSKQRCNGNGVFNQNNVEVGESSQL